MRCTLSALFLAAAFAVATPVQAAWNPDAQSGAIPVVATSSPLTPLYPASVADGAGGVYIVWNDFRSNATNQDDVYLQHVSAAGTALWTSNGIAVATGAPSQGRAHLCSDGAGGVIVTWQDSRNGAANYDVFVQRYNSAGTALWTAGGVDLTPVAGNQLGPDITADGAGGAVVIWTDNRTGIYGVYVQKINATGAQQWLANGVLCSDGTHAAGGVIVSDAAGGVWVDFSSTNGNAYSSIYAQHVNVLGSRLFAIGGFAIAQTGFDQNSLQAVPDGSGGQIVVWSDFRTAGIVAPAAQHVAPSGAITWGSTGQVLRSNVAQGSYDGPFIVSDNAGGAWVAWDESRAADNSLQDIYVQHCFMSGVTQLTAGGLDICTATGLQSLGTLCTDGEGGVIAAWSDYRSGVAGQGYAQRLNAAGSVQWTGNGLLFEGLASAFSWTGSADGNGGAIIVVDDDRAGLDQLFAQRLDHYGVLGNPSPAISRVKDVPFDQGGKLVASWTESYLDPEPYVGVLDYGVFRAVPGAIAQAWRAHGVALDDAALTSDQTATARLAGRHVLDTAPMAANGYAWELVGTVAATHDPAPGAAYSFIVPTLGDSIGAGNPYTKVRIQARNGTLRTWYSAPDSGYSVDNIPPVTPAPFTAQYAAGTARLHWQPNTDADLAGYRVYRGSSASFTPSPASLVAALGDTGYVDAAGAPAFYKLTAVDAHGNESPAALVQPAGTLGVQGGNARVFFLAAPQPNPARGGATLRYGLARAARVQLALYDAAGRLVRTLADGPRAAGEQAARWDSRDDSGRVVAPGLYLARLSSGSQTITRRLVVVE